jgi:hypothetical protein
MSREILMPPDILSGDRVPSAGVYGKPFTPGAYTDYIQGRSNGVPLRIVNILTPSTL